MSKTTGVFIFVLGAVVGSAVTWQYTKKYYEQRAQEEIDSVKEAFSKKPPVKIAKDAEGKDGSEREAAKVVETCEEKPDISHYARILDREEYVTNDTSLTAESKPYVISPDEFGEFDEYDQISLTYYADQVLADENDDKITDVDSVIGAESLTYFGEYEDDSVFVRNDRLKCDYEILMDGRTYSEILKQRPHQKED